MLKSIAAITEDRRLQAFLKASSFGAFIEGAAGFGTPAAIASVMLGRVAGICLVANTAPVAFGDVLGIIYGIRSDNQEK